MSGTPLRGQIAIVGMAGMFSQAPDLATYWSNILQRVNAIHPTPDDRFDRATFYDPKGTRDDRIHSDQGGFIDYPLSFDAAAHGIMPASVQDGEAEQFLLFQLVKDAIRHAGWEGKELPHQETQTIVARGNYATSAMLGQQLRTERIEEVLRIVRALHPEHTDEDLERIRQECLAGVPRYNAETAMSLIPNLLAGRVANRLDLMGTNFTLDGACASSIIAVELTMRDLLTGKCDLGIVGATHSFTNISFLTLFSTFGALSRSGRCRPFDEAADGILPGDGLGVILLKRLEDAERDGDRIFAIIKGVGSSSDGKALGLIAPRAEGEELAVRRALTMADVSPDTLELIEAHGTGTPTGDQTEIGVIQKVFGSRPPSAPNVAVGSVKSMIGHCMPASGMAGILKTALALHHQILPPMLGCEKPHPAFGLDGARVYINSETRPWFRTDPAVPRRAGVNAFGFGGVNSHVVLEEYIPKNPTASTVGGDVLPWDSELCLVRASTREALVSKVETLLRDVRNALGIPLTDVAWTLSLASVESSTLAIVATSVADLAQKLERALPRLRNASCKEIRDFDGVYWSAVPLAETGKVAGVFPGGNSTSVNMLRDLCLHFPEVRAVFEAENARDLRRKQVPLTQVLFPPAPLLNAEGQRPEAVLPPERELQALLTANRAIGALFQTLGLKLDMVVGNSQGEWSALEAAQVVDLNPEGPVAVQMDQAWAEFRQGPRLDFSILAVSVGRERLEPLLSGRAMPVYLTVDNCPHQALVAGSDAAIAELSAQLRSLKIPFERLPLRTASHTPVYEGFAQLVKTLFSWVEVRPPALDVYSSFHGEPLPRETDRIRDIEVAMWMNPVQFRRCIENMYSAGARIFVELGHRGTLTAFVNDTLEGKPHVAVASDLATRSGIAQLNHCVGILCAHGVPLNVAALFAHRSKQKRDLSQVPPMPEAKPRGVPLTFGNHALRTPAATPKTIQSMPLAPPEKESAETMSSSVMKEYFQLMERFLALQREVMQAYLVAGGTSESSKGTPELPTLPPIESLMPVPAPTTPPPAVPKPSNGVARVNGKAPVTVPVSTTGAPSSAGRPLKEALLSLVSDRTGYPVDMLGLDLNLEGDLGIDSIKRTEIVAAFGRQLGLTVETKKGKPLNTLRHVLELFS